MRLIYKSKGGRVEMGGGYSPLINITKMSGFELPAKEYESIEYATENGTTTIGEKDLPRTITLSGDLLGGQREIMNALKAFYYEGELYCDFGRYKRKIGCKCINMEDMERRCNGGINSFALQFRCDYPYFNDWEDTTLSLAGYQNIVTDTFELPCVFTEMLQEGRVVNTGDKITFPVIQISSNADPTEEEETLIITNHTTGAVIEINHVMRNGEAITLNLATRQIESSLDGRITNHISDNTVLSNFYLDVGVNNLSFYTSDTLQPLTAELTFNRVYIMAVR